LLEKALILRGADGAPFYSGQKKAAANAAAEVRRWIKERQINVSEHR
jgi:hypothetical protein